MPILTTTNIDYLIPTLRLHLGDIDSTAYRYMDEWLRTALVTAIKALQRWWGDRYIIDPTTYDVSRYAGGTFRFDSPVIQDRDERPIILMASILTKSGQLESNSWNVGSWRDAEISVSNIETSRAKQFGYSLDWEELQSYIKPPSKQLFGASRISIRTQDDVE